MFLPDELWQKIALLSDNKLKMSSLNKYFYSLIHELDQEIYKEIDLTKTPKLADSVRVYNTLLRMEREDLICPYINRISHIKSLITYDLETHDISYLTNLTSLTFNGPNFNVIRGEEFDKLINLTELNLLLTATFNLNPLLNLVKLKISDSHLGNLDFLNKLPKLKDLTLQAHNNQRQFLLNFKVDRLILLTARPHHYQDISHITEII